MRKFDFLYGINPVAQSIAAKRRQPERLFFAPQSKSKETEEVLSLARKNKIPTEPAERSQLEGLANSAYHQGLVLKTTPFPYGNDIESIDFSNSSKETFLLLDQIQDPQNLGAILRTAHCSGVGAIILPERNAALVTPSVVKASAGAAEWMQIFQVTNLVRTIGILKENGFWIYGADSAAAQSYLKQNFKGKTALVVGNEGSGLRQLTRDRCDVLVSIPMQAQPITSLNVSVATGVLLFEVFRQQTLENS